jgi:hypothetical protein
MERGLMWLPLLATFIWLTWAGWNEYQKVQAYEAWAVDFERSKYDIYAVLGQKENTLTWGKPTRSQPKDLETISLLEIDRIQLEMDSQLFNASEVPKDLTKFQSAKKITLNLKSSLTRKIHQIPFTDLAIAINWLNFLERVNPNKLSDNN